MTKFDSLITDLYEGNNISTPGQPAAPMPTNAQQKNVVNQPNTNQAASTNQPKTTTTTTTPPPPATNNAVKPNYNQLMKDFNDPNIKINNIQDLKKYGMTVS
jgi:hypothetical protein